MIRGPEPAPTWRLPWWLRRLLARESSSFHGVRAGDVVRIQGPGDTDTYYRVASVQGDGFTLGERVTPRGAP